METETHRIEAVAKQSLLKVWLIGFWSPTDAQHFMEAEQRAARDLPCREGQHLVLADLSQFKLQSVVTLCERFIATAGVESRRLALVGGEGLAWMQIKRMLVRENIAAFNDAGKAERWLLTGDANLLDCVHEAMAAKAAAAASALRGVNAKLPR